MFELREQNGEIVESFITIRKIGDGVFKPILVGWDNGAWMYKECRDRYPFPTKEKAMAWNKTWAMIEDVPYLDDDGKFQWSVVQFNLHSDPMHVGWVESQREAKEYKILADRYVRIFDEESGELISLDKVDEKVSFINRRE
ncbi:MAG: hypothetical protein CMQ41_07660 [Gammaproteobacteria bacterium]|nr:hypothetical protein [Gammaproteobacteria bacterium]|tara:strand:- start:659 stop:1081 length:423 start_codon:yes stop_codon:yes gene_type:complete